MAKSALLSSTLSFSHYCKSKTRSIKAYKYIQPNDHNNFIFEYGYMQYSSHYNKGLKQTEFIVIDIGDDIDFVTKKLKQYITACFVKNRKTNIIFFKMNSSDVKYLSYKLVKQNGYPHIEIKICSSNDNNLCVISGDQELCDYIHSQLDFLVEYNDYVTALKSFDHKELKNIYYETFGQYPKYCICKNTRIYNDLIKVKRKCIINKLVYRA